MIAIQYCDKSETIRQMPQNYMLAKFEHNRWVMEPDLAADRNVVVSLTLSLMEHSHKWNKNGIHAILGMSPYIGEGVQMK